MDAEIIVFSLIKKLQNESTKIHPMFENQAQDAINNLHSLRLCLKYEEHDSTNEQKIVQLLQAVYSAEDAIDTVLTTKEIQRKRNELQRERKELKREWKEFEREKKDFQGQRKKLLAEREYILTDRQSLLTVREELQSSRMDIFGQKVFQRPFMCFSPLRNEIQEFTHEMKKLKNEVKALRFHNARLRFQNDIIEGGVVYNDNASCGFQKARERQSQQQRWGRISNFCLEEETDVVGLENEIKELLVRLIPEHDRNDGHSSNKDIMEIDEQDRCDHSTQVIAVVGERGSGKTTLVTTVYNRVDVKRHFTNRAWVHVSSLSKARDVLVDILKQINPDELVVEEALPAEELMYTIDKRLKRSKYLIVIEKVEAVSQVLQALQDTFCSSTSKGNRIIIISSERNNNILSREAAYSTLRVHRLNDEESWKLFSKKVRIAEDDLNDSELKNLKEDILNTCCGLPLRIVLLGGLLSTKQRSYHEWLRVTERANYITGDIMALSYQDLPSAVKPCFLYLMLFPKGFEIPVRRLIHLWCAEGFTASVPEEEIAPEDLSEMYFEELVIRNMIQVIRWRLDGSPKTCRVPNVLYDFFFHKASDAGFLYHQHQSSTSTKRPPFVVRRLAAYLGTKKLIPSSSFILNPNLRTYIAFDMRIPGSSVIDDDIYLYYKIVANRGFRLLKVLDLEDVYKPHGLDLILRKMLNLRYLGLRSTFLDGLPESVNELPCLETLDVKHTRIYGILKQVRNAKKLKHLYMNSMGYDGITPMSLTNLHTLWGLCLEGKFYANNFLVDDFFVDNFLKKLTRLRKLGISFTQSYKAIIEWVSQLTELQSLKLRYIDHSESYLELGNMVNHRRLQYLYLRGQLRKTVIDVQFLPPNLSNLTLSLTRLEDDPMPVLGQLTQLNILRLFGDSYIGEEMQCLRGGFPKLRVLKLWKLQQLKRWIVEEGAMPCLRELEIRRCWDLFSKERWQEVKPFKEIVLTKMPTTLKEIVLTEMPSDFSDGLEDAIHVFVKINRPTSPPFSM